MLLCSEILASTGARLLSLLNKLRDCESQFTEQASRINHRNFDRSRSEFAEEALLALLDVLAV